MRGQITWMLLWVAGCAPGGAARPNGDLGGAGPTDGFTAPDAAGTDASLQSDAGGADLLQSMNDLGTVCAPTPGNASNTVYCDLMQLAVLEHSGAATELVLTGRLSAAAAAGGCALIDGVDIKTGTMLVQHLNGGGQHVFGGSEQELGRGAPVADIAKRCLSDAASDRFEMYSIVVTGRVNGGSFTASCGQVVGGTSWPPSLRLTCHHNVEAPPNGGDAMVMTQTIMGHPPATSSSLFGRSSHGPGGALTTLDGTARIIPKVTDPTVTAFDSTWQGYVSETGGPDSASDLQLFANGDVLGPKVCPPSSTTPTPSAFLARVTGSGGHGAYSTEIFVYNCVASMLSAKGVRARR
jgi:hypothetical protein